jgi:menaquinol-cytochrome c reductase iron-sulfur subunit
MAESNEINRRDFVKVALASVGSIITVVIGLPAISYLISPATKAQAQDAWIPLGPLDNFPVGTPTLVNFTRTTVNGWEKTANTYGAFVMRYTPDELKVFSNLCTHLSCRVNWKDDQKHYICPCHDGHFDEQGLVVSGPPPRPLDEYEHKVENGILSIHFVEA